MNCFIIGYGPGIGQGAAQVFHAEGYRVALFSRAPEKYRAGFPPGAQAFAADAGDEKALSQALETAVAKIGPPSAVIYNAVAFRQAMPTQVTPAELLQDFRVNVAGALLTAQILLPKMKEGSLLFTGGGWALYPSAAVSSTAIGKAGLRHLVLMLDQELQGGPVRTATVTVMGSVAPDTAFDPAKIGRTFLDLHKTPKESWKTEVQFVGG